MFIDIIWYLSHAIRPALCPTYCIRRTHARHAPDTTADTTPESPAVGTIVWAPHNANAHHLISVLRSDSVLWCKPTAIRMPVCTSRMRKRDYRLADRPSLTFDVAIESPRKTSHLMILELCECVLLADNYSTLVRPYIYGPTYTPYIRSVYRAYGIWHVENVSSKASFLRWWDSICRNFIGELRVRLQPSSLKRDVSLSTKMYKDIYMRFV